jgi:iron complex outermembrane recepter protein
MELRGAAVQRRRGEARLSVMALALVPAAGEAADLGAPTAVSDIVVTAQRRDEDAQQVPISIQTFTGRMLEAVGGGRLTDIDAMAPSLSFGDGSEQGRTGIRGIIDYSRNAGYDARVGVYVDGVYYSRSWMNNLNLYGIRQVEILRGPQGTLFGRNSNAGLISITTVQPSATSNGAIEAEGGNFGYRRLAGRANLALGPDVSLQLTGSHVHSTGYYDNVQLGRHNQGVDANMARAQLLFRGDGLEVTLAADYSRDDNSTLHYTYVPPAGTDPFSIRSYLDDGARRRMGGVSLTAKKTLDDFEITSITAYRSGRQSLHFNNETGSIPFLTTDFLQYADQFSHEVRIASPSDRPYDFVAGLFYFWGKNKDRNALTLGSGLASLGLGQVVGLVSTMRSSVSTYSAAGFFQLNVRPVPLVELFGGLRLTHERKRLNDLTARDPSGLIAIRIDGYQDRLAETFLTPRAGINLHPSDKLLLFATVGRGFKSGGWNVEGTSGPTFAAGIRFKPETVTSYETGIRSTLLDDRVRFNLTGFYERFDRFQVFTFVNVVVAGRTVRATSLSNVGKVSSKGIELDMAVVPASGLTLSGNYSYNKSAYDRFPGGAGTVGATVIDADGVQTPYAPVHKAYLAADYVAPLPGGGLLLSMHVGYSVQSSENFDPKVANPVIGAAYFIKGYDLADARLGLAAASGRWRASAWGRNIFDKHYIRFANRTAVLGRSAVLYGQPRAYGITLGFNL